MKTSINILNYNSYEESKRCIESCLKQNGVDFCVLLIDNCSTDDSFIKLKNEYTGKIDFFQTGANYGYAGGNNIGISYCFNNGCKYTLILNSDITLVGSGLLKNMIEIMKNQKDCAVVAPLIFNVTSKGDVLNQNDSTYLKVLRKAKILPPNYKLSDTLETISEAQGSALLVDNEVFLGVGGFPEHYFMYGEESCFAKK